MTPQHDPARQTPTSGTDNWAGAIIVGDGITLPGIWSSLHVNADAVNALTKLQAPVPEVDAIDRGDFYLLALLEQVKTERWIALCQAAGWTSYGAVALSWCKGSDINQVAHYLRLSGARVAPELLRSRALGLLNPKLRPQSGNLSELIYMANSSSDALTLLIATCSAPVIIDVAEHTLHRLSSDARDLIARVT